MSEMNDEIICPVLLNSPKADLPSFQEFIDVCHKNQNPLQNPLPVLRISARKRYPDQQQSPICFIVSVGSSIHISSPLHCAYSLEKVANQSLGGLRSSAGRQGVRLRHMNNDDDEGATTKSPSTREFGFAGRLVFDPYAQ
jgi:hypothetical protein